MADSDQSEKTEEPSQHKLDEAKKKGSVSKSLDLNSFVVLLSLLVLMMAAGQSSVNQLSALCHRILSMAGHVSFDLQHLSHLFGDITREGFLIITPIVATVTIMGIASSIMQTGLIFTFEPLKPDLNKMNPVDGIKKLFSIRLLFETVKSLLKLVVFGGIVCYFVLALLPELFALLGIAPRHYFPLFFEYATSLIFGLLAAFAVIALIDLIFSRHDFLKKMRMSKHEVKEEYKRREGDPHVKSKRKDIQNELRKKSNAASKVPNADVVVTNPTHLAILLKYDRQTMKAPVILGKASGSQVEKIKQMAWQYRVPVMEQKSLARFLFRKGTTDGPIPPESYVDVARIFRHVYQQKAVM